MIVFINININIVIVSTILLVFFKGVVFFLNINNNNFRYKLSLYSINKKQCTFPAIRWC